MKISEYLDELPDGYRELAVENFIEHRCLDLEVTDMADAILQLDWYDDTQFYSELFDHYCDGTPIPPLPRVTRNRAWRVGIREEQDKTPPLVDKRSPFTQDAKIRKQHPVYSGFVKYFPDAMAMVAHISWQGGAQHGHDELHWDRSKSADESDALMRHLIDYTKDGDIEELTKVAWRAMAWLQKAVEHDGMEDQAQDG